MKILITGGSGFIGLRLYKLLKNIVEIKIMQNILNVKFVIVYESRNWING